METSAPMEPIEEEQMLTGSNRRSRTRYAVAACASLAVLVPLTAASAQAAPPTGPATFIPPDRPLVVPAGGDFTVPAQCATGTALVLRVSGDAVRGRCAGGIAARFKLSPATVRALSRARSTPASLAVGRSVRRLRLTAGAKAHLTAISGTWNDATLDCYPPGGGLLGGSTYNNSVDLTLNWHSSTGNTFWAQHAVFYEEYWNGSGPYYRRPDGQLSSTTPYYGPYRVSPSGVLEWMVNVPTYGTPGSITQINPWINEQTYPKSVSIRVRAQVGLSTWNGSAWSAPTWHYANALHAASGYAVGICALN